MKLLVITQTVDKSDTTLGFFTGWINQFAQLFDHVDVICLKKGNQGNLDSLPKNVQVFSLGKETHKSKASYIRNFYTYIWQERNNYDAVFVHMNQEYVLLGGLFWKLWNKKVFLWRNHPQGSVATRLAVMLADKVFCTSTHSYTAQFGKTKIMPAGIDVQLFQKNIQESTGTERKKHSLLMFGRIAPIKKIEVALDALGVLKSKGSDATLTVVGDTRPQDQNYLEILKQSVERLGLSDRVQFQSGVPFDQAPRVYQAHDIFLNFTPSGSFDKTVIEALASGCKVVTTNASMRDMLPKGSYSEDTAHQIVESIQSILAFDETQSREYGEEAKRVVTSQSLETLMDQLYICINPKG